MARKTKRSKRAIAPESARPAASSVLGKIPEGLRDELLLHLNEIAKNFRERRWEPSELNGGKLCEVVYTILRGYVDGKYPAKAKKPANFHKACSDLESADAKVFPRSVRIQIPRTLIALYEVRNNRGVGHVGGDVNPNHMDAVFVLYSAKWVVAELVRIFHEVEPDEAAMTVDALVERELPLIWEIEGKRRVLSGKLTMKEKMLLLVYREVSALDETILIDWLEHSNASVFRRDVLRPSHKARLIEYDETKSRITISPLGAAWVEDRILQPQGSRR